MLSVVSSPTASTSAAIDSTPSATTPRAARPSSVVADRTSSVVGG
jgi:hypothetical protein